MDQFKLMVPKLMASVFKCAVEGDIGAAKLFLEKFSEIDSASIKSNSIQNQTSYI
jgi:hypothetical protein